MALAKALPNEQQLLHYIYKYTEKGKKKLLPSWTAYATGDFYDDRFRKMKKKLPLR